MKLEWDDAKAASNLRKHGVAFAEAERFEFDTALISIDDDFAYGEERIKAHGFIGPRLHLMVDVDRGTVLRLISLRVATRREKRNYEVYILKGW